MLVGFSNGEDWDRGTRALDGHCILLTAMDSGAGKSLKGKGTKDRYKGRRKPLTIIYLTMWVNLGFRVCFLGFPILFLIN